MEEPVIKVNKKIKSGPLKSTPGFLKCLRNVYLYFKEEKEKGALNIPINSFIERTAVACGVGRKTLYNYAKKGLFDEHPIILQPKEKKKLRKCKRLKDGSLSRRNKKCGGPQDPSPPSNAITSVSLKKKPPFSFPALPSSPKIAKNAMIQTDPNPVISRIVDPTGHLEMENSNADDSDEFSQFIVARDQKVQQLQVLTHTKIRETETNGLAGAWTSSGTTKTTTSTTTIKRDVDYFSKNNIWNAVYNLSGPETPTCIDMSANRMATCQQQSMSDHLTDL